MEEGGDGHVTGSGLYISFIGIKYKGLLHLHFDAVAEQETMTRIM